MYGATISRNPAPYLVRLYIRSGPTTAPGFQKSGAVLGPALYWIRTMYGASNRESIMTKPTMGPHTPDVWQRTWSVSI